MGGKDGHSDGPGGLTLGPGGQRKLQRQEGQGELHQLLMPGRKKAPRMKRHEIGHRSHGAPMGHTGEQVHSKITTKTFLV